MPSLTPRRLQPPAEFADPIIIESCIGADQRTLYVSGAFGFEPEMPQLLADILDRDILVVDESHLPAIGAAAMCSETPPPSTLDESIESLAPALSKSKPQSLTRSVFT